MTKNYDQQMEDLKKIGSSLFNAGSAIFEAGKASKKMYDSAKNVKNGIDSIKSELASGEQNVNKSYDEHDKKIFDICKKHGLIFFETDASIGGNYFGGRSVAIADLKQDLFWLPHPKEICLIKGEKHSIFHAKNLASEITAYQQNWFLPNPKQAQSIGERYTEFMTEVIDMSVQNVGVPKHRAEQILEELVGAAETKSVKTLLKTQNIEPEQLHVSKRYPFNPKLDNLNNAYNELTEGVSLHFIGCDGTHVYGFALDVDEGNLNSWKVNEDECPFEVGIFAATANASLKVTPLGLLQRSNIDITSDGTGINVAWPNFDENYTTISTEQTGQATSKIEMTDAGHPKIEGYIPARENPDQKANKNRKIWVLAIILIVVFALLAS